MKGGGMVSRRVVFGGGLASLALAGCGGQQPVARRGGDVYIDHPPTGPTGLDAIIDISHGVGVSDFAAVRRSGILGVIHKATEGGDFVDRSYAIRQPQAQAEAFVQVVRQQTGRLPVLYTHPQWANGQKYGRRGLSLGQPVQPGSLLARCDLWLADYREQPEIPWAWAD